jgi:ubiquinone/menaquinone biosynthesis C-methylase UbiE
VAGLITEPGIAVQETAASAIVKNAPNQAKRQDERIFAISSIKYPNEPVLDTGTGHCACIASILVKLGIRVVALDKDRGTIRAARRFLATQHVNKGIRLLCDDITASGLPSNSFRNIVCFNVLHHVSPLESALGELHRILATDGRLIISDFDEQRDGFPERLEKSVQHYFRSVTAYRRPSERLVLICEK